MPAAQDVMIHIEGDEDDILGEEDVDNERDIATRDYLEQLKLVGPAAK